MPDESRQVAYRADRPPGGIGDDVARPQAGGGSHATVDDPVDKYALLRLGEHDAKLRAPRHGRLFAWSRVLRRDDEDRFGDSGARCGVQFRAVTVRGPGHQRGRIIDSQSGELVRYAIAVFDMAASENSDDDVIRMFRTRRGQGFGHGAIPGHLRLDETPEGGVVRIKGCFFRLVIPVPGTVVLGVDLGQGRDVTVGWRKWVAQTLPFRGRNGRPSLLSDPLNQLALDIERNHGDAVHPREIEQGLIQRRRKAPDLLPFALFEELAARQVTGDPAVEHRLEAPWEGFETDDKFRGPPMQRGQNMELPRVVFGARMALAEQHDRPPHPLLHQGLELLGLPRIGIDPTPGIGAGVAERRRARIDQGTGTEHSDQRQETGFHHLPNMAIRNRWERGKLGGPAGMAAAAKGRYKESMTVPGAIAAGHPVTAEAAAEILRDGGNAFDAALAAVCAACVAEPVLASLGGGGFLMAQPAGGAPVLYDFFPQTPRRAKSADEVDFFPIIADFGTAQQEFHIGLGAMAVPGMVGGLARISRDLGSMPLARVLEPAIALADRGVEVNDLQAYIFDVVQVIYLHNEICRRVYGSRREAERTVQAGEVMAIPDLARTFEALAREGEDLFYRGEIAKRLTADCAQGGGLLTAADLEAYTVEQRRPLSVAFGGGRIFTNPPPSMGGLLIAFGLHLIRQTGLDGLVFGSPGHLERLARVMEATQRARIEARLHELPAEDAEGLFLDPALLKRYGEAVLGRPSAVRGTTQISVVDRRGNAASVTVTNGEGAAYIIPGTGVMMNNMLGEEDINPHGFHRWPENARLSSMMAPSLIHHADGALEVLGSGGSNRIRTAMLQVLVNELLFGMDARQAIESPRIHVEGRRISVEAGYDAESIEALARGFPDIEPWDGINFFFGGAHSVRFDPAADQFTGAGDPRRGGAFLRA